MALTKKQIATLREFEHARLTVYDLAGILFGEKFGIYATRAQGRLQTLKRMGLVERHENRWTITASGRHTLSEN